MSDSQSTLSRDYDWVGLERNFQCWVAAKQISQSPSPDSLRRVVVGQVPDREVVLWLAQDPDSKVGLAYYLFGRIAEVGAHSQKRSTACGQIDIIEPTEWQAADWGSVAKEIEELRGSNSLIPSEELRELARRVGTRDYSSEDIREWAKKLSQISLSKDD